ncbi:MAG: anti-sigma factor family protein [Novosphingobium sp.]
MTVTPEQLAAYADGELDEMTAARVRKEIEADPALAQQLAQLTSLSAMLSARFDPILADAVPERLTRPIADAAKVVDIGTARAASQNLWQRREFRFGAGAAIAASLVVAVLVGGRGGTPQGYADTQLAAALDGTLSGQTAPDGTRMLISFRDGGGQACRGYAGTSASGIACRDDKGWKLRTVGGRSEKQATEYQQAGSADAAVMAAAQDMAAGPALDQAGEQAARQNGWKPQK